MIDCHIDCPYVKDLCQAAENVGSEYYLYNRCDGDAYHYMERVFAYELYHQLRLIMESGSARERYNGLYLCGEQMKSKTIGNLSGAKCPDLVLHGSFSETDRQEWVCEIKHRCSGNPSEDLYKLSKDLKPLGFSHSVFLCFGHDLEVPPKNVMEKKDDVAFKDIICIVCGSFDKDCIKVTCNYLKDFTHLVDNRQM